MTNTFLEDVPVLSRVDLTSRIARELKADVDALVSGRFSDEMRGL